MKKKILAVVSAALLSVLCAVGVAASEWTLDVSTATSKATAVGSSIELSFESDTAARSASAEKEFDFSENEEINIAFGISFQGTSDKANRRVYLRNSSSKAVELINIPGTDFEVLGSVVKSDLNENTEYAVRIGINPKTKDMIVLLDDETVFDGNIGTKWKVDNLSAAKIYIRNNTTAKTADIVSEMKLNNVSIGDKPAAVVTSPANGSDFVDANTLGEISVTFSSPVTASSLDEGNFALTRNGETVEISVEPVGFDKVNIKPQEGFLKNSTYELTVGVIYNFFGEACASDVKSSFTTATDGYEPPEISIEAEKKEIYDNQTTKIQVTASSENGIKWIKLYSDGEAVKETSGNTSLSYTFSGKKGEHTLYAVASDENGGEVKSEEIKITVLHNETPTVVTSIKNGESYSPQDLEFVDISATDSDGEVVKIEVFAGSKLVAEFQGSSGTVNLSGLSHGRNLITAIAYDNMEASGSTEVSIVLSGEAKTRVYLETDFESYQSSGTSDPSGIMFVRTGDCKTISSTDYGKEHGTVVEVSTEGELVDGTSAAGSWCRFNTTGTKSAFSIEVDIYLGDENVNPAFLLKHPSQSIAITQVEFNKNGEGLFLHNNKGASKTVKLETKRWYRVKYQVDMLKHTYSFWLDGELLADNFGTLNELTQIDSRFVINFAKGTPAPAKVAFDNLKITLIEPVAQITGVGYDNVTAAGKVSPEAKTLTFTLNTSLAPATLNKDTALLKRGSEKMIYEAVSYDDATKTITLTVEEPLRSASDYTFELTSKVSDASGVPLTNGAFAYFQTGYKPLDVMEAEVVTNGDSAYGTGTLINDTNNQQSLIIIVNVFDATKLTDTFAYEEKVPANSKKSFTTDDVAFEEGNTVEMYFWNTLQSQGAVTVERYSN